MKNKKLKAVVGLMAVAVIGGSLAYFNQTMTVENPFDTNKYESEMVEHFKPTDGDNWQPGATVNKDIQVNNTGDYDVIVRVKFDETWARKGSNSAYVTNTGIKDSATQTSASDGLVDGDYSVVKKNLSNADKWFYNENDGYYYYLGNLKAGQNTGTFLDSVKLIDDADMGKYDVIKYYTTADSEPGSDQIGEDASSQWKVYEGEVPTDAKHTRTVTKLVGGYEGYADSDYKLTITAQTVQASKEAVNGTFGLTGVTGSKWTLAE